MKNSHKNILGLNTVKAFIVILLAIAIIGVVTLIVLGVITSDQIIAQTAPIVEGATVNETLTTVTETGESLVIASQAAPSCVSLTVWNSSNGALFTAGNFTFSDGGCTIAIATGVGGVVNNSDLVVNYTFSYRDRGPTSSIGDNVSNGLVAFFGNAVTFFALLAVVVIILIISLVVVVVNRFGSPSGTQGTQAAPSL